jgi:hypothetical protein
MLGGQILADTPDFIDNRILGHKLFSHEFFRCTDDRAVVRLLLARIVVSR